MLEQVELAFRAFMSALQTAKLYGVEHQKFAKSLEACVAVFAQAFEERGELVFGIIGEELAFEKDILFELSKAAQPVMVYLKAKDIERISFARGMTRDDLAKFFGFLLAPKEEQKKDLQEYLTLAGVRTITVGKIKASTEKIEAAEAVNHMNLYMSSMDTFTRSLDDILDAKDLNYLDLRFNVGSLFESIATRHQELLKLTVVKRYDLSTFAHIVNVAILSIFFSSKLGLEKDDVLDIGIAALFHDIGKMGISRKIVKKTDKLSDEEFEKIKGHTIYGAELLLKYVDTLGELPVLAAFEHHLKSDFKSYPRIAFPQKPHLSSAIIEVCDIYDALFSRRSYKAGLPPNVVYEIMMKEKAKMYYPQLVDVFFKLIGVWPIGTLVKLNDGSVAVVREENENGIFAPVVEVVSPQAGRRTVDLAASAGAVTVEKSIDPLSEEGKPFAALI
ncbi:MAG: HD domain-containing protein [Candidatus Omnitrophica bacterium]|nr:HD domain-containing protein [Candidatus Omnitrophota bacterium]